MSERWVKVPGWERFYEVSNWGRVRSRDRYVPARGSSTALRRGRILVPVAKQGRYLAVTLADGTHRVQYLVHGLVLLAFRGPRPAGLQCCHKDDDKANNVLSNLRYGTAQDNSDDKHRNGYGSKGEKHPSARLKAEEVQLIRSSTAQGKELATLFGVSPAHISAIRRHRTWKHI